MFSRIYSKLVFPNKRPRNDAVVSRARVCVLRVYYEFRIFFLLRSSSFCIINNPAYAGSALFVSSSFSPSSRSVFRRTAARPIERVTSRFVRKNTVFQSFSRCFNLSPILRYEYYQIYCILAALFSRFAFSRLANTLLPSSPLSPAAFERTRVRCVSYVLYSIKASLVIVVVAVELYSSSIILTFRKSEWEKFSFFFFPYCMPDERRATRDCWPSSSS